MQQQATTCSHRRNHRDSGVARISCQGARRSRRRRREHRGAKGAEWGGVWGGVHSPANYGVWGSFVTFNDFFSRTTWVSWYQKGKTSLNLNEARDGGVWRWQWNQVDHKIMQTICTSLQTDNHINTSSLNFYRPDALPDVQPTVSKHCWQSVI